MHINKKRLEGLQFLGVQFFTSGASFWKQHTLSLQTDKRGAEVKKTDESVT